MTSGFISLLTTIFDKHEKNLSYKDFERWLLKGDGENKNSMIYQLLLVAVGQKERLEAQSLRAVQRTSRRNAEKAPANFAATSAYTNDIDNIVENFLSILKSLSPLSDGKASERPAEWFLYLQEQFLALSIVENALKSNRQDIVPEDDKDLFELLKIKDKEKERLGCGEKMAGKISFESLRCLLMYRIQICLLIRAAEGTFVQVIPFRTDQSATITDVATARFILIHCMKKLQTMHDTSQSASYSQLLQQVSNLNLQLEDNFCMEKKQFPLQYTKKITASFEKETCELMVEFKKYFEKLSVEEKQEFRNLKPDETTVSKKRLRKSKLLNKKNDENDNDEEEFELLSSQTVETEISQAMKKSNFLPTSISLADQPNYQKNVLQQTTYTPHLSLQVSNVLQKDYDAPFTPNSQTGDFPSYFDSAFATEAASNTHFAATITTNSTTNVVNLFSPTAKSPVRNYGFMQKNIDNDHSAEDASVDLETLFERNDHDMVHSAFFATEKIDISHFEQSTNTVDTSDQSAFRLQELIVAQQTIDALRGELNQLRSNQNAEKDQLHLKHTQQMEISQNKIFGLEKLGDDLKTQLHQTETNHAAEKEELQKRIENLQSQLQASQTLQIDTMKAKVLAERAFEKIKQKKQNLVELVKFRRRAKKICSFF